MYDGDYDFNRDGKLDNNEREIMYDDLDVKAILDAMNKKNQGNKEKKVIEDKIPYDKWLKMGWLRLSGDSKIDYHDITKWFLEEVDQNGLRPLWVGYDSWNAEFWKQEMLEYGFDMVEVRQGFKTESAPLKQMKAATNI